VNGLPPRLEEHVAAGEPVLFLSAHLDDAILSCGGLISELSRRCPMTVATLFTEASAPPHTYAARSSLRQCRATDAASLYEARRAEDQDVLAQLGIDCVHLGATDALYRPREIGNGLVTGLGRHLPEVVHRYPTYRFDIAKGRVSRGDRNLIADLCTRVADLVVTIGPALVFSPVGVGRHVDHLVTRTTAERLQTGVVYYSDFPYDEQAQPDPGFLRQHRLLPWTWGRRIAEKHQLIRAYRTQVDALFPGGRITGKPETYFETCFEGA
jgi:LmbE family N-acetylglucosaminyl deacetylase